MEKRKWEAKTSKWKAALEKGMDVSLKGNENIFYLGASSGTTVGHLSERTKGTIYAVEKAFMMAIPLVKLAQKRENIMPLFCDARDTNYMKEKIDCATINILFCDIPSSDQVDILIRASSLVGKDCKILFSLKTQSISQGNPMETLKNVEKNLGEAFEVKDVKSIEPFHKKHWFFVLEKK